MTTVGVVVSIDGDDIEAGTLYAHHRGRAASATFVYDASYLASPQAYQLDPGMPLVAAPSQTSVARALFGAVSDSAPDRWGRTLLDRAEARAAAEAGRQARRLREIDYVLGVRDDLRQGALRFRDGTGSFVASEQSGIPALTDLPELLDLAAAAESDEAPLSDLRRLIRAGSSLGGARPKAHVRLPDGRIAIAKFPSAVHDTWDVIAWEKVALELAAAAGVDVPRSTLHDLAGRHVLILDRFDRRHGVRLGYVSAMTMLEAADGDRRSYLEIAEVLEQTSSRAGADLEQLWRRIVLNVMISNTDDHLRNHGFLHAGGTSWTLSPAFDLNPDPSPGPRYLSTSIDTGDDSADVDLALSVAPMFRLSPQRATRIVSEVVEAVSTWRDVAGALLPKTALDQMAPAFATAERG